MPAPNQLLPDHCRRCAEIFDRVEDLLARGERGTEAVAHFLGELAEPDKLPAFAADRRAATARRFLDLILLPMQTHALFGERLTALRAEVAPHVARTVAFFLAACRQGGIGLS